MTKLILSPAPFLASRSAVHDATTTNSTRFQLQTITRSTAFSPAAKSRFNSLALQLSTRAAKHTRANLRDTWKVSLTHSHHTISARLIQHVTVPHDTSSKSPPHNRTSQKLQYSSCRYFRISCAHPSHINGGVMSPNMTLPTTLCSAPGTT